MKHKKKVIQSAVEYKSLIAVLGINVLVKSEINYIDTDDFSANKKKAKDGFNGYCLE